MHRRQEIYFALLFFLALVLHCSQTCVAGGHPHASVSPSASVPQDAEHLPCHAPQPGPQGAPARCPDCTDHVFLKSLVAGTGTVAVSGSELRFAALVSPLVLPTLSHSLTDLVRPDSAPPSGPLYLLLSILRL